LLFDHAVLLPPTPQLPDTGKLLLFGLFPYHPTFYVLPALLLGSLEAESAVVAEPEVLVLVSSAADLSPEIPVFAVDLSIS
jgi:hypothetical protein